MQSIGLRTYAFKYLLYRRLCFYILQTFCYCLRVQTYITIHTYEFKPTLLCHCDLVSSQIRKTALIILV